ncbi:hypothetical protein FB451DRAFT_1389368 [Mycena latifolia]|nr:hypothetical protein FB451DRAFT_1389368 [Mycena latifolia]
MSQLTVVFSGNSSGLGLHTVHQLTLTPNVLVFIGSRKITAAEESLAGFASEIHPSSAVVPVQLEITDENSIKAAHATVAEHLKAKDLGGLDVLINNAAILTPSFKETSEVNVFGTVAITESIRPLINAGGAILNISSGLGSIATLVKRSGFPNVSGDRVSSVTPYSASKSALNNLTVQWAIQEQKKGSGIRVVSISPGYNATKLNNFTGTMSPAEGCKVILKAALETEGRTSVCFNKDGDVPW